DLLQPGFDVALRLVGERRGGKALGDLLLVLTVDRKTTQVIAVEKVIEHVGGDHRRGRNGDLDAAKAPPYGMRRQQPAHEREPARLAAERAGADTVEAAGRVERRAVEVGHH